MHAWLQKQDEAVAAIVCGEEEREANHIDLIPSENYVSRATREALYSSLTNKYAEGYPGKRYYGGQQFTDAIETLAIERATQLFHCEYANVQPLSGAVANIALYFALLEPGDTVLSMDLSHGGHLTHGHPVTAIAKLFRFVRYAMSDPDTGAIDFDALRATALRERPKLILAGFSAYPRELPYETFVAIAREVNAYVVADVAHIAGLIAGGAHVNPLTVGFDALTSTTHKTLRGPRGGFILINQSKDIAVKINKSVFPGLQGGPHMHQIAGKAVAFQEALHPSFRTYAQQIIKNAKAMAEVCAQRGFRLITGGTDNHLLLMDTITSCSLSGRDAEHALERVGIIVNKNVIPDDTRGPLDPSGIRFGSPAITTRGFNESDAARLATLLCDTLTRPDDTAHNQAVQSEITHLAQSHPIPDSFVTHAE